jgi:uncharacterized membrane protein YagU involved in acid resistance
MFNQVFADVADKKGRFALAAIAGMALLLVFMSKVAPVVLGQPMDPAAIVNKMLGLADGASIGVIMHFMLGLVIFPLGYMLYPFRHFPGPQFTRGLLYGVILATLAGAVMFPLAGVPMFLGSLKGAIALYMVHMLYTALVAAIIGKAPTHIS